jgi:hypothetical protein
MVICRRRFTQTAHCALSAVKADRGSSFYRFYSRPLIVPESGRDKAAGRERDWTGAVGF